MGIRNRLFYTLITSIIILQSKAELKITKRKGAASSLDDDNNYIAALSRHVQFICTLSNNQKLKPTQKIFWQRDVSDDKYTQGYNNFRNKIVFDRLESYHTGTYVCIFEDSETKAKVVSSKALSIKVVNMEEYRNYQMKGMGKGKLSSDGIKMSYSSCSSTEQLSLGCSHGICSKLGMYGYDRAYCICEPEFMGPKCEYERRIVSILQSRQSHQTCSTCNRRSNTLFIFLIIMLLVGLIFVIMAYMSYRNLKTKLTESMLDNTKLRNIAATSRSNSRAEVVKVIKPVSFIGSRDTLVNMPRSSFSLQRAPNSPRISPRITPTSTIRNSAVSIANNDPSGPSSKLLKPPGYRLNIEEPDLLVRSAVDLSERS